MSLAHKWNRNQMLAVPLVGLFLILAPSCSANRHMVRIQTQLQLLDNDLAIRQRHMNRELELMTQLVEHNSATLESVAKRVEEIRQLVATFSEQEKVAKQERQLKHLCGSAKEMNRTMVEMEARASEMKDLQYGMLRLIAPSLQPETATAAGEPK